MSKLGFMSFFIKAVVDALQSVPEMNARIDGDDLVENHYYDIGVAVGTERGLVVPVIRDADKKSFAELEKEVAAYAGKARDGKLRLGRPDRRSLYHHEWRHLRFSSQHADLESSPERHTWNA